jgi:hypothetical protein
VESGLLKPDPAKAKGSRAKGNAEFLAKHEKAQEKKEKVSRYSGSGGCTCCGGNVLLPFLPTAG